MLANRLRHRVTFQRKTRAQDPVTLSLGAETWTTVVLDDGTQLADVPAEVLTGPGREFRAAAAEQSMTTARINLRWFPGLQTDWRVLWDGRVYNIRSKEADTTGRREWRLQCEDGVNSG